MMSLLVFPIRFLYSMGIGGAIVALVRRSGGVACAARRADRARPAHQRALAGVAAASRGALGASNARTAAGGGSRTAWCAGPLAVALVSALVLLAAAIPALRLQFTSPGANLLPASAESRQVGNALADELPRQRRRSDRNRLKGLARLRAAPGRRRGRRPRAGWQASRHRSTSAAARGRSPCCPTAPHTRPSSSGCSARLRALARPYSALVGGATAFFADQKTAIATHIPLALLILMSLTAGFLFLMTGSLTIPIKALAMNMLSVGVAVGLQVLIFQDGHLSGPLGFTPLGGLEESSLVLMLVLAFALATDYEVFVLARIKEAHDDGLPNREAIALGIERTGRIVTAAALLFCVAIGALDNI